MHISSGKTSSKNLHDPLGRSIAISLGDGLVELVVHVMSSDLDSSPGTGNVSSILKGLAPGHVGLGAVPPAGISVGVGSRGVTSGTIVVVHGHQSRTSNTFSPGHTTGVGDGSVVVWHEWPCIKTKHGANGTSSPGALARNLQPAKTDGTVDPLKTGGQGKRTELSSRRSSGSPRTSTAHTLVGVVELLVLHGG